MNFKNLILLLIICLSCTPTKLTILKNEEIIRNPHGYIVLNLTDDIIREDFRRGVSGGYGAGTSWGLSMKINNKLYLKGRFNSKKDYKIPIPVGNIIIKYKLSSTSTYYIYSSAETLFGSNEKIISFDVRNNDIFRLKIICPTNGYWVLGCAGSQIGIPWPKYFQEVAFEVEKIEPAATKQKSGRK